MKTMKVLDSSAPLPHIVADGVEAVMSKISIMANTQVGTWLTDSMFGLPLQQWANTPTIPPRAISSLLRYQLLAIDGVESVDSIIVSKGKTITIDAAVTVVAGLDGSLESIALSGSTTSQDARMSFSVIRKKWGIVGGDPAVRSK